MQNWLALSSTSDLDLASLPMPVEGQEMADTGSATSQWQRLTSNYPTIHLNPFYQTDAGSVLYLLGQLESSTKQVIYVTLAGLSSQDQVWINNRRLVAVQVSNPSHTYPLAVQLKVGLNTVGLKISSLSPLIKWEMWPSEKSTVIKGQVTDQQGTSMIGAEVTLQLNDRTIYRTYTNEMGRYLIVPTINHGKVDLSAQKDLLGSWKLDLSLALGSENEVNVVLQPALDIEGLLTNYAGQPHPNVVVEALATKQAEQGGDGEYRVISDAEGKYQLINLKPGSYYLRCHTLDRYQYFERNNQKVIIKILSHQQQSQTKVDLTFAGFKKGFWRWHSVLSGIESANIFTLHEDGNSNLWLGAEAGVTLYDGSSYANYQLNNQFQIGSITDIDSDRQERVWIAGQKGLSTFDQGEFHYIASLADMWVSKLFLDNQGIMWIGTQQGLWQSRDNKLSVLDEFNNYQIFDILQDKNGLMWLATSAGVFKSEGESYQRFELLDWPIKDLSIDQQGTIFLVGGNYIWSYQTKNNHIKKSKMPRDAQNILAVKDRLWVWQNYGQPILYQQGVYTIFAEPDGLARDMVRDIYESRDGTVWFGIFGAGLSQYETTFYSYDQTDGLLDYRINDVYEDNQGRIWFGTRQGGASYLDQGKVRILTTDDGLPDNFVRSIHQDSQNRMWFLTGRRTHPIVLFEDQNFSVLADCDEPLGINPRFNYTGGFSFFETEEGAIWFMDQKGVGQFKDGNFRFFTGIEEGNFSPSKAYQDPTGKIWLASPDGILFFDGQKFQSDQALMPIRQAMSICGMGENIMVATRSGLYQYDQSSLKHITSKDGLVFDDLKSLYYQESSGILWIGTNGAGVTGFDGSAWTTIDSRDGLRDDTIRDIYEDWQGYLWLGATRYQRQIREPKIRIDRIIADKDYTDYQQPVNSQVRQRVSIQYHAVDFVTLPEKRQYRYKVTDLSLSLEEQKATPWRQQTSEKIFEDRFQQAGRYLFQVQTIDRDLNYSEPAQVEIRVNLPWFMNLWILVPTVGLSLGAVGLAIFFAVQFMRQRLESQRLQALMLEQERATRLALEAELADAHDMQMALLPESAPAVAGLQVAGRNIAAKEVGGDFFDYLQGKRQLSIAVGDVSGKGLKGAMNAVMASGILRLASDENPTSDSSALMSKVNKSLCQSMEQDMNVTMVLAQFDLPQKQMILANAGQHAYPLLKRGTSVAPVKAKGLALGMIPSIPYKSLTLEIQSGDLLLFMTDGITEPRNSEGLMYEESGRFHQVISQLSDDLTAEEVVESIIQDVIDYMVDEEERDDDITLVAVKVT